MLKTWDDRCIVRTPKLCGNKIFIDNRIKKLIGIWLGKIMANNLRFPMFSPTNVLCYIVVLMQPSWQTVLQHNFSHQFLVNPQLSAPLMGWAWASPTMAVVCHGFVRRVYGLWERWNTIDKLFNVSYVACSYRLWVLRGWWSEGRET